MGRVVIIGIHTSQSTVKATFNTPCELVGVYQEREPGILYENQEREPGCCMKVRGCTKLSAGNMSHISSDYSGQNALELISEAHKTLCSLLPFRDRYFHKFLPGRVL